MIRDNKLELMQVKATCPYAEQITFVHAHPPVQRNIIFPSMPGYFQVVSFPQGSQPKTLYLTLLSPIRAKCLAYLILLDFITRNILRESTDH